MKQRFSIATPLKWTIKLCPHHSNQHFFFHVGCEKAFNPFVCLVLERLLVTISVELSSWDFWLTAETKMQQKKKPQNIVNNGLAWIRWTEMAHRVCVRREWANVASNGSMIKVSLVGIGITRDPTVRCYQDTVICWSSVTWEGVSRLRVIPHSRDSNLQTATANICVTSTLHRSLLSS